MIPNEQTLLDNLGKISYTLDRAYLSRLEEDYGVLPFNENYNSEGQVTYASNIRALRVKRCVIDKEERVIDCFKNILGLFIGSEDTLALVFKRTPNTTEMFFVIKNIGNGRNEDSKNSIELLADSIRGNFPGTEVDVLESMKISDDNNDDTLTSKAMQLNKADAISMLSNIPSEKSKDFISQGIEKLLNGVVPKTDSDSYKVVFLADAMPLIEIRSILNGFEELATAIAPFASYQFQSGRNETETKGEMESLSHSEGVSHSITKTHSINIGVNVGIGMKLAKTIGSSVGFSAGYGYSWGTTDTKSTTDTKTKGTNHSISLGTSQNTTYTYKSYMVSDLIDKIEATIKKIDESKANGLWRYATYILSSDAKTTLNVANFLRSITQGDESFIEPSFVQTWIYEKSNGITAFGEVLKYVSHFCHPVFGNLKDRTLVTPAANVSTNGLANVFAFPNSSVQSLPVIECVRFGREPHSLDKLESDINLGCAYHMHTSEFENRVLISKEELKKHTFITGSTGSGKSNTIYKLLFEICLKQGSKTNFLVIEPAKGEYKDVFGGHEDVTVYGTNPYKTPNLLQINPFSFPEGIHVLEHVDRLVEVFNACWPMYAAMPAILKDAMEKSYELAGWNLKTSKYISTFPTFNTILEVLPKIIKSSDYSDDTKGDYIGALKTRVKSLATGIQGLIFNEDIDYIKLFNENVIIDISRLGSSETKALIMGIIVLKLQEFRMTEPEKRNNLLKHITILEEAHHLLRRTSSEQSQESSNLQGKSVEMLANAIAEMRTFGEGFVISDQSPGLMDMSVIRNTNTKIILRLPDESDRALVGKAAGLSDIQISELSKLKTGVAAITQSGWLEPVLCYIDEYNNNKSVLERYVDDKIKYNKDTESFYWNDPVNCTIQQFLNNAFDVEHTSLLPESVDIIRKWVEHLGITKKVRSVIELVLSGRNLTEKQKMLLIGGLFVEKIRKIPERELATSEVQNSLVSHFDFNQNDEIMRRVNDLFLTHFPVNICTDISFVVDKSEGGKL